ncbi:MAG: tryptophan synthase subunit alpha [Planctomycetota bacterium]
MSAIDALFHQLRNDHRRALISFVTAGDPDISTSGLVLKAAIEAGADLVEIGIPYSDPIADGPVIQASYQRALDSGFRLHDAMTLGRELAAHGPPRVTMVSYSIIHRIGPANFVAMAQASGYSGAIVPDLLVEESEAFLKICQEADFSLIQLVTPTTPRERQKRIAANSTGFLYYVSVTGITGERTKLPADLTDSVSWLREQTELPICIGFGISNTEIAAQLAPVADGLIVGSAIVRRIAEATPDTAPQVVGQFVADLRRAIDHA